MRLLLKEECKSCKRILFPKDLLKGSIKEEDKENTGASNYLFLCSCRSQIYPNLKVRIGDFSIYKTEDTLFLNPIQLRGYLEDRMQLDDSFRNAEQLAPEVLREYNKNLYWNLIWYFAEYNLPYDFMVGYSGADQLWEEFIHTNDHLKVRNKTRVD